MAVQLSPYWTRSSFKREVPQGTRGSRVFSMLRHVRGLRLRLTLSYTILTLSAILALGAVFVTMVSQWLYTSAEFPPLLAGLVADVTPETVPYLDRTPVDSAGLAHWLTAGGWQPRMRVPFDVDLTSGPNALVAVADQNGRILATTNASLAPVGAILTDRLAPTAASTVQAALAGRTERPRLAARGPNGTIAAAAPIVGTDGKLLGVFFLEPDVTSLGGFVSARALSGFLTGAAVLAVLFGLLGTLFGYIWARWLTGRLRVLNAAVDAWSKGDLDVVARDASDDELGQLARQLNRMAEQLRTLLEARQELAVVEERQRLARDLHDAVKQQVFATAMQVGAARALLQRDPTAAGERLVEAERLAAQAQQELTTLIRELRPAALVDKGLAAALNDWVSDWSRQTGIAADFRARGVRSTPLAVEQAVFRIAQEALANVARHSGAKAVEIELGWEDASLHLIVTDDGHGFDVERSLGRGMGLSSMSERVEALGGTITIDSSTGGTRVEARIPFSPSPPPADRRATAATATTSIPSPRGRGDWPTGRQGVARHD